MILNKYKNTGMSGDEPALAKEAVLLSSCKLPDDTPKVSGYDWNNGLDYNELLKTYIHSGFQATNFGKAVLEINKMVCNEKNDLFYSKVLLC